ncbi:MAG: thioredoxin [bacterium]
MNAQSAQHNLEASAWAASKLGEGQVSLADFDGQDPSGPSDAGEVLELTDANFDAEVLAAGKPTLVDFWAEWCGPCKAVAPIVASLAREYAGRLRVGKLNVDENPQTAGRYGIRGIPNLMIFAGGEAADQVTGVRPKADLKAMIDRVLRPASMSAKANRRLHALHENN